MIDGSILGARITKQKDGNMNALDHHFHRTQNRKPVRGAVSVAKCSVQLAGIDAPTNAERLALYVAKRESARSTA